MSNSNLNSNRDFLSSPDKEFENNIRPGYINEFSGQGQIIDNISVFIKASKLRGEALDHILFHGPPDRKSTRLNSSHIPLSRMPSSA